MWVRMDVLHSFAVIYIYQKLLIFGPGVLLRSVSYIFHILGGGSAGWVHQRFEGGCLFREGDSMEGI